MRGRAGARGGSIEGGREATGDAQGGVEVYGVVREGGGGVFGRRGDAWVARGARGGGGLSADDGGRAVDLAEVG